MTNKSARGGKGALIATIEGTKAQDIQLVLDKIPEAERKLVKEVTLDFCPSMEASIKRSFPNAEIVADRFHVQKLVSDAVQEQRIKFRWKAIEQENKAVKKARKQKNTYQPKLYENGDTKKQLLARSRYLLFKPKGKWTIKQNERSKILFREFSKLEHSYNLSMLFRSFYEQGESKSNGKQLLEKWYKKVEEEDSYLFSTAAEYIKIHEDKILNYFNNRSTNAGAESFNAKLKGLRALTRGVRDKKFFLFRIAKIYG